MAVCALMSNSRGLSMASAGAGTFWCAYWNPNAL